jgi:hypothetical protein
MQATAAFSSVRPAAAARPARQSVMVQAAAPRVEVRLPRAHILRDELHAFNIFPYAAIWVPNSALAHPSPPCRYLIWPKAGPPGAATLLGGWLNIGADPWSGTRHAC